MLLRRKTLLVTLVLIFFVPLECVTVKPVRCPTNKIAPRRRAVSFEGARTYGAFYDLLAPGGSVDYPQSGLVERPQEESSDEDDCGDIEDYDDTDLSSLSQSYRRGHSDTRFFFGGLFRPNPGQPAIPPRPTRPPAQNPVSPYWSAGYFGTNYYRPPVQQGPSAHVKPVHDGNFENHATYRPEIVGGPVGHIVGHSPARPPVRPQQVTTHRPYTRYPYSPRTTERTGSVFTTRREEVTTQRPYTRYPYSPRTTERTGTVATNRRPRPSRPRAYNNDGILTSFVDLLFK